MFSKKRKQFFDWKIAIFMIPERGEKKYQEQLKTTCLNFPCKAKTMQDKFLFLPHFWENFLKMSNISLYLVFSTFYENIFKLNSYHAKLQKRFLISLYFFPNFTVSKPLTLKLWQFQTLLRSLYLLSDLLHILHATAVCEWPNNATKLIVSLPLLFHSTITCSKSARWSKIMFYWTI